MTNWLGDRPIKCDLCGAAFKAGDVFVDGKLAPSPERSSGPWAVMCSECVVQRGCGVGTGRGQMFDWMTLAKLRG